MVTVSKEPLVKLCRRCDTIKPLREFKRDANKGSGYGSACRPCDRARSRAHYAAHRAVNKTPKPESLYKTMHLLVQKKRGPASEQQCAHCGKQAHHWAYDHMDPDEVTFERVSRECREAQTVAYSADVQHYIPLCRSCHTRFDRKTCRYCGERHWMRYLCDPARRILDMSITIGSEPERCYGELTTLGVSGGCA